MLKLTQPISYLFHKSLAKHRKDILGFDNTILRVLNFFLQAAEALMNEIDRKRMGKEG